MTSNKVCCYYWRKGAPFNALTVWGMLLSYAICNSGKYIHCNISCHPQSLCKDSK